MRFDHKKILVTGATRGIGREIARRFAAAGAVIAVHGHINRSGAQETLDNLAGDGHLMVLGDIGDSVTAENIVETTISGLGGLDILINNAGIYEHHPIDDLTYEDWQAAWTQTLKTNLIGPANLAWCAVNHMRAHGGGRIVNVSSRGAFRGEPRAPAYGASKAGLNAFSQSLAQHLAPYGIFVGAVAPGFVDTDMAAETLAGLEGDEIRNQSPLGRVATPEEVAHAVLFLASDGAEFSTGAIIDVNGASYLRS
jgi:NAD(P)-dependent dehydrogenase (short-subunit alcohol dehydrogenase family)